MLKLKQSESKGWAVSMGKYLKTVLCSMICMLLMVTTVSAAGNLDLEWRGDYSDNTDPKLVFTFTSPAKYIQQVSAVIYPASVITPGFSDYAELKELKVTGGVESTVTFNVTNDFSATNGEYIARFKGNGYMAENCIEYADIYVITPAGVTNLLGRFASADSATLPALVDEVSLPLQLSEETDSARKTERISLMLAMKNKDFNGSFNTLENVRDSWRASDMLAYINKSTATAEGVKEKLYDTADIFGIDMTDIDMINHIDELCQNILLYNGEYNNNVGIKSITEFKDAVGEYLGVIVINNSTDTKMRENFEKYKTYFDISPATFTDYYALTSNYQGKALRELYNKGFERPAEVVSTFTSAVALLKAEAGSTPPVVIVPGVTGGGKGGIGVTGGASDIFPTKPVEPETQSGFRDVTSNHWAYNYVTQLAQKKIISGYDDNTFRPNNNVTREEFVKMIINATGLYSESADCEFGDVTSDAWYYSYVASASTLGIVSGRDDMTFGVGTNITRQDVAVIAARIIKYLEKPTSMGNAEFTDTDAISDYAQESVNILTGMGIINGFDDGAFKPHNALTRAEAATIISKLISSL